MKPKTVTVDIGNGQTTVMSAHEHRVAYPHLKVVSDDSPDSTPPAKKSAAKK